MSGPPPDGSRGGFRSRLATPLGLLVGLYVVLGVGFVAPRITTDGLLYFAETRSAVLDGDMDVADEYRFDPSMRVPGASEGRRAFLPRDLDGRFLHTANEGIVVLFAPFVVAGHFVAGVIAGLGGPVSMDGYDLPYVLAIGFGTNALVALALALLAGYARQYVGLVAAVGGAAAIWLGSSLVHWSLFRPGHAHAPAVLLESLFVVLFLARARNPADRPAWLAIGGLWALAVSIRPITGLYAVVPLGWLAWLAVRPAIEAMRDGGWRPRAAWRPIVGGLWTTLPAGLLFLAGAFVGRLPQLALTGDVSLAGSSYYEESGFLGAVEGDPLGGVLSLLVDWHQGQLWWVPIVPLAVIGLAWYWRRDRLVTVAGLAWLGAIWLVVGMLGSPQRFGGPTYASRHLVEATPVYVLGAAGLIPLARSVAATFGAGAARWGAILAAVAMVGATAWGAVQYVAAEVVPGAAVLDPVARMARVLGDPGNLRRLLVGGPAADPEPGAAFIGGRLLGGGGEPGALAEAALALGVLAAFAIAVAVLGRVVAAWSSAPAGSPNPAGPSPAAARDRGRVVARSMGMAAWLGVAVVGMALVAPVILRPRFETTDGDRAIATVDAGRGSPSGGRLRAVVVGSSPTGNGVVSPPTLEVGRPDPAAAELRPARHVAVRAAGLTTTIVPPAEWTALTGIRISVEPDAEAPLGLVIELRREESGPPALTVVLQPEDLAGHSGTILVPAPLGLEGSSSTGSIGVTIRPGAGDAGATAVGVTADRELAAIAEGLVAPSVPIVDVGGEPLFARTYLTLPPQASLDVRTDGSARMRVGPWAAEGLLREATDGSGWSFPGPSVDPGTWADSVVKTSGDGGGLVFRIDAPWPIRSASVEIMATAVDRAEPAVVSIEASDDGESFAVIGGLAPESIVRQQHVTATLTADGGVDSVWFRVDLAGAAGATALNAVWFDLDLVAPAGSTERLAASLDSDLAVNPVGTTVRVRAESLVEPTVVERLAWSLADAAGAAVVGPGPLLAIVLAALAGTGAVVATRRAGRTPALGLAVVAAIWLGAGLTGLPRSTLVPRTQPFADGVLDEVVLEGAVLVATVEDASYISPILSIPAGSVVDRVAVEGSEERPPIEVRSVSADGTVGSWQPVEGFRSDRDGLQVKIALGSAGASIERIRVHYRPPIGL